MMPPGFKLGASAGKTSILGFLLDTIVSLSYMLKIQRSAHDSFVTEGILEKRGVEKFLKNRPRILLVS